MAQLNAALALQVVPEQADAIATSSGARAEITVDGDREKIRVRDDDGRLVFEFDPRSGRTELSIPAGDLVLNAPGGDIKLAAKGNVQCAAGGQLAFDSATGASIRVRDAAGVSGLRVAPGKVALASSRDLDVRAKRARARIDEARYDGSLLEATVKRAAWTVDELQTLASRVIARAKDVYQSVEGLHQVRAGRLRHHARDAYDVHARTASIMADGDMRIDGEKIHLG